jgi:flagellar protein FliL
MRYKILFILLSLSIGIGIKLGPGGFFVISQAVASAEPAKEGTDKVDPGPSFVKMDPLVVPVVDPDGVSQVISLAITLEVMTPDDIVKIEMLKPRVKDAMIQNMYGLVNHREALDHGVLQVGYVKKRLMVAIEKVVGPGVLKDVLLQMVQQNPV